MNRLVFLVLSAVVFVPQTAMAGSYLAQGVIIKQVGVNFAGTDATQIVYSFAPGASVQQDACNGAVQFYLSKLNQNKFDKLYQACVTAYLAQTPVALWVDGPTDCTDMTEMILQ